MNSLKGKLASMDEQKQLEDRWRELDELLGLGPVAPKSETPPEPPAAPVPVAREMPAEPEHQPRIEEEHQPLESEIPPQPQAHWEAEFDEDADTEIMEQDVFESLPCPPGEEANEAAEEANEAGEEASEPGATGSEDGDKPRRGRRRRRRGKRKGGPEQGEGSAPASEGSPPQGRPAPSPREPAGNPRDQGRRGRQGGRPRDDEDNRRPKPVPQNAPRMEPVEMDEFQDDEPPLTRAPLAVDDTDFSNWDVPSWQDLISSLYRPDR